MLNRDHFGGGTRGNAFHIVEKLPKLTETAFPLLKCLRTHYGQHLEQLSEQKCTRLPDFAYIMATLFRG